LANTCIGRVPATTPQAIDDLVRYIINQPWLTRKYEKNNHSRGTYYRHVNSSPWSGIWQSVLTTLRLLDDKK
jgi:hypothetical protein